MPPAARALVRFDKSTNHGLTPRGYNITPPAAAWLSSEFSVANCDCGFLFNNPIDHSHIPTRNIKIRPDMHIPKKRSKVIPIDQMY